MRPRPRIMTVYGTRPEAIKVAPIITELERSNHLESIPVTTGQHREMLDQVNEVFGIVPAFDLNIFEPGAELSTIFARVLERLDPVLQSVDPTTVIVQGDTSTSTAAALAAFHRRIPVVHLEAGLRSGEIHSPFPEEANRRLTSQISALHLPPTVTARDNLVRESINPAQIVVTGNTVIDALLTTAAQEEPFTDPLLAQLVASNRPILLVTAHRRESWGDEMVSIGRALARLARDFPEMAIILPAHRNPIVRDAVLPQIAGIDNVYVTEPLPYAQFTHLLASAALVLTDSGGVQEEAPSLGKPVLVMRENTERPEAVDAGAVRLVGTNEGDIVKHVTELLTDHATYAGMACAINPYGDGHSAPRAVAAIDHLLGLGPRPDDWLPEGRE